MKESIILCGAAVSFFPLEITAHAGKPVDVNGMLFRTGILCGFHFNLNILSKQGQVTSLPVEFRI